MRPHETKTQTQRGAEIEQRVALLHRRRGYQAERTSGSRGFYDVHAVKHSHTLYIQCKRTRYAWSARRVRALFAEIPRLPKCARFELWLWIERRGWKIYREPPRVERSSNRMKCKNCGKTFDPANRVTASANEGALANVKYCSEKCDRQWNNRETYKRHRESIIARVLQNQRRAQKGKRK